MDQIKINKENKIRSEILKRIYEIYMVNPRFAGYLTTSHKIAADLGYEHDEVIRPIEFLGEEGLLDISRTGIGGAPYYQFTITSEGIKKVEGPGPFNIIPIKTEIEKHELDEGTKLELAEILKAFREAINELTNKAEAVAKRQPKAHFFADLMGRLAASYTKGLIEP